MDAFLPSFTAVTLAEIGDKTQLLAIMLAARFRAPVSILMAILVATLANHFLAALLGAQLAGLMDAQWFGVLVALSFIAMAGWTLIPDEPASEPAAGKTDRLGAFTATLIVFFLVEIGDKTQVATLALAAQYQSVIWVTLATTLGMMVANAPGVLLGERIVRLIPMKLMRFLAALVFLALGLWILVQALR